MTTTTNKPTFWEKYSAIIKIITIGILILLLLIPTAMIRSLIREREYRQYETIMEVSNDWGGSKTLVGPVLTIPYYTYYTGSKGQTYKSSVKYSHFLPEQLTINSKLNPQNLNRGLYDVMVYDSKIHFTGNFLFPEINEWNKEDVIISWEEAILTFGINDMRGINDLISFKWNESELSFEPVIPVQDVIKTGLYAKVDIDTTVKSFSFSFDVNLKGSNELNFVPVGKETIVEMVSEWGNPSFHGNFLPDKRKIDQSGFSSYWKILQMNREFPQKWIGDAYDIEYSSSGVTLLQPVGTYQKTMRSVKYSVLFITLTFLIFFFVEIINKLKIHPINYILVGLGLCLFYVLLLSLSEHLKFIYAYIIGSAGIIGLITVYSISILKKLRLSVLMLLVLIILYSYIYILLQLQDYALLMGSIGLFIALATVMYLSRKINWYTVGLKGNVGEPNVE